VAHLASARARLNRPPFVLALAASALAGRVDGHGWPRDTNRGANRGWFDRQRSATAFVDSRHRSHTSVWAGVSAGRAGRVAARRQLGHCAIARMLVSFVSVAEVGDRHLLVASGVPSGSPRGGQHLVAGHHALTRQAGSGA
jgi:hypothetical protein